jgi:ZIP family zinc transporter
MVIYICISLAMKTLSGIENTNGHGHSHFGNGIGTGNESLVNSKMDAKMETKSSTVSRPRQRRKLPEPLSNDDDSTQAKDSSKDKVVMSAMRQGLMWTGLNAALGIAAHNLPEGLVVYNHTIQGICEQTVLTKNLSWWEFPDDISKCLTRGVAMTFAIALHNIPEGMAVAAPIFAATESKWEAMKWCILSSLGEPIAAVLFGLIFSTGLTKFAMAAVNATTAGIMIALCLAELMPTAASLAGAQATVISNVVGQFLMFVSIHFMRKSGVH